MADLYARLQIGTGALGGFARKKSCASSSLLTRRQAEDEITRYQIGGSLL